MRNHQSDDGSFRYKPSTKNGSMLTGAGILCHQQWGTGGDEQVHAGVDWLEKNASFKWAPDKLYHHYYIGQAMFEYGGVKWIQYNQSFRDTVLSKQNPDGAFAEGKKPSSAKKKGIPKYGEVDRSMKRSYTWKDHYQTCLATLMLEVYYRYLPATNER